MNFDIQISPLKIDNKGSFIKFSTKIVGEKWFYDKIINKGVDYFKEKIQNKLNEKFNELPKILENFVRNLPKNVLNLLEIIQIIYKNRIIIIFSVFFLLLPLFYFS